MKIKLLSILTLTLFFASCSKNSKVESMLVGNKFKFSIDNYSYKEDVTVFFNENSNIEYTNIDVELGSDYNKLSKIEREKLEKYFANSLRTALEKNQKYTIVEGKFLWNNETYEVSKKEDVVFLTDSKSGKFLELVPVK
ncbi:MAG: hypothetical protein K2Q03_09855 [Sphingobacteriaceae bacterium]|nr:hypothetical protein [Sphingobacteriaceae bacterium]